MGRGNDPQSGETGLHCAMGVTRGISAVVFRPPIKEPNSIVTDRHVIGMCKLPPVSMPWAQGDSDIVITRRWWS